MHRLNGLIVSLAATGLLAQAAEPPGFWLQAQAGLLTQGHSPCLGDVAGYGAGLGQWAAPAWGWELSLLTGKLRDKAGLWASREFHADATALWAPLAPAAAGAWKPFLRAGLGISHLENPVSLTGGGTSRFNLMGGVGTQLAFGRRGFASGEGRAVRVRADVQRTEYQVLLGAGFRWTLETGGL
jgi:hypothetical protein